MVLSENGFLLRLKVENKVSKNQNYPVRGGLCITPGFNRGYGDAGRSTVRAQMPMDAKTTGSDGRMYC